MAGLFAPARSSGHVTWLRTHAACRYGTIRSARYACFAPRRPGGTRRRRSSSCCRWRRACRARARGRAEARELARERAARERAALGLAERSAWQRFSSHSLMRCGTSDMSCWKSSFRRAQSTGAVEKLSTRIAAWRPSCRPQIRTSCGIRLCSAPCTQLKSWGRVCTRRDTSMLRSSASRSESLRRAGAPRSAATCRGISCGAVDGHRAGSADRAGQAVRAVWVDESHGSGLCRSDC